MISVIIPAHDPDGGRLTRTLDALRRQDLPVVAWELVLVDNASEPSLAARSIDLSWHPAARIVREDNLGLTSARMRGFREAGEDLCVLVDDDNLLNVDYLSQAQRIALRHPDVGLFGGKSLPEFESPPPTWLEGLLPLLALRDDGNDEVISSWANKYPSHAPIGAGMVIRRKAALDWVDEVERDPRRRNLDRAGSQLVSGGDNDIVISVMSRGHKMGYFPSLSLTHLIPAARCEMEYAAALNRAVSRSWMQVLTLHGINPWPQIPGWTVPMRKFKAWFAFRAWSGTEAHVRWAGACGHFEGRVRE